MSAFADRVLELVVSRLRTDATLQAIVATGGQEGVYKTQRPELDPASEAPPVEPYITVALLAGGVASAVGGTKVMGYPTLIVRIFGGTGQQRRDAMDRWEALLLEYQATQSGVTVTGAVVLDELAGVESLPGLPDLEYLGERIRLFAG